jgi:hypothetical protein
VTIGCASIRLSAVALGWPSAKPVEIEKASVVLKGRESAKSSGENHTHEATRRNLGRICRISIPQAVGGSLTHCYSYNLKKSASHQKLKSSRKRMPDCLKSCVNGGRRQPLNRKADSSRKRKSVSCTMPISNFKTKTVAMQLL